MRSRKEASNDETAGAAQWDWGLLCPAPPPSRRDPCRLVGRAPRNEQGLPSECRSSSPQTSHQQLRLPLWGPPGPRQSVTNFCCEPVRGRARHVCGESFRVLASPRLGDPLLVSKDRKLGLVSVRTWSVENGPGGVTITGRRRGCGLRKTPRDTQTPHEDPSAQLASEGGQAAGPGGPEATLRTVTTAADH